MQYVQNCLIFGNNYFKIEDKFSQLFSFKAQLFSFEAWDAPA